MPELERALDRVEQRLLAGGVALGALQAPLLRPAAVAVHHAGRRGRGSGSDRARRARLTRCDVTAVRLATASTVPSPAADGVADARERATVRRPTTRARARPVVAALPGGGEDRPGPGRDGRGGRRGAIADGPPPRRAGRHRHRQVARLPRAGHPVAAGGSSSPPPPRRCRTSWPARTCRSSPSTSTVPFDVRRAEGPVQLRLPPAGARGDGRQRRPARARRATCCRPRAERGRAGWPSGRRRPQTGDRAELDCEPSARAWAAVSVDRRGVPGRGPLPVRRRRASPRTARAAAAEADVVVVNTHLYGLHLASRRRAAARARRRRHRRGPPARGRHLRHLRHRDRRRPLHRPGPHRRADRGRRRDLIAGLDAGRRRRSADALADAHRPAAAAAAARRPSPTRSSPARGRVDARWPRCGPSRRRSATSSQRKLRALKAAGSLARRPRRRPGRCPTATWRGSGAAGDPRARGGADRRGGRCCAAACGTRCTAVLTSATIPAALPRPGRAAGRRLRRARRRQPVRLRDQRAPLLRRPPARPARAAASSRRCHDELAALITAAGGRTLALFTSCRAMDAAAEALRPRLPYRILTQTDLPKPALVAAFADDESTLPVRHDGLLAGRRRARADARLVTIDRLPFPRPDEPLLQARRERAGAGAFRVVDLPAGRDAAGPGRRAADPHRRPTAASSRCSTPGWPQRQLPLGHRAGPAADAPHPRPRRGRGVPPELAAGRCGARSPRQRASTARTGAPRQATCSR